jgi:hypothetical protein
MDGAQKWMSDVKDDGENKVGIFPSITPGTYMIKIEQPDVKITKEITVKEGQDEIVQIDVGAK